EDRRRIAMSRATRGLRCLGLCLALAAPACGVPNPVLLLSLDGVPPEAARIRVLVGRDGRSSAAVFERDGSNAYLVAPSSSMPPMIGGPTLVRLALDLPATAVGTVLVKVSADRPDMTSAMMPPPLKSVDMACQTVAIEAGQISARTVTLMEG